MASEISLVLCLLSGYLFVHATHFLRYRAQALNGTRLLFETAGAGLPFLILSRLLVTTLPWPESVRLVYPGFESHQGDDPRLEIPVILPIKEIQSLHLLDITDLET